MQSLLVTDLYQLIYLLIDWPIIISINKVFVIEGTENRFGLSGPKIYAHGGDGGSGKPLN